MRILIVGNGGREHALAWKFRKDFPGSEIFSTRPNGGMLIDSNPLDISPEDIASIAEWSSTQEVDLVAVGPEGPLASGLIDLLATKKIPAFGPTESAARIESSKSYAKKLMARTGIPTADFECFTDETDALSYIRKRGGSMVVKASGLAAGKGAIVCKDIDEATDALKKVMTTSTFGDAGKEVVIEECMKGEELSVFALSDGKNSCLMLPSQDHKRIGEGDSGPNTGGMGAYAPISLATDSLLDQIQDRIIEPTLWALAKDESEFKGLLYAGIMVTDHGPKVVEFNCRFGDPETQVVLPLLDSSLLDPMIEIANGQSISNLKLDWSNKAGLTTVLASSGYPESYPKGLPIDIPDECVEDPEAVIFQAGTSMGPGGLVTSGGRVAAVTGIADTLRAASLKSLSVAEKIQFEGKQFRKDIGWRELARSTKETS